MASKIYRRSPTKNVLILVATVTALAGEASRYEKKQYIYMLHT